MNRVMKPIFWLKFLCPQFGSLNVLETVIKDLEKTLKELEIRE